MSDTTTGVVTLADAIALGTLAEWVTQHRTVTWAIDGDVTRLMTGVARHFVKGPDNFGFIGSREDVRDAYIRISAGMEWTIPVREAMKLMADGLLIAERPR
jgi:hypothetical protein